MTGSNGVIRYARDLEGDDDYYMDKMKEILEAPPNNGPPKHPGKLLDNLYIGNQDNAEDYDLLPAIGITHVLNCAGTRTFDLTRSRYPPKLGITGFLMMPIEDYEEFDIMEYFPEAITFLDRAKAAGGKALVHCNLGVNRSGAMAAAYLMVSQRKPLLKVITELKDKRSVVLCNEGFRRQLIKYARARGLLDPMEQSPNKEKKATENGNKEDSKSYSDRNGTTFSNSFDSVRREWSDATSSRIDQLLDEENGSTFRNLERSYSNGLDRTSSLTKDYYNGSSSTYKSTSRKLDDGLNSDDDFEAEMDRNISATALKARLAAAKSRITAANGYTPASSVTSSSYSGVSDSAAVPMLPLSPSSSSSLSPGVSSLSSPYIASSTLSSQSYTSHIGNNGKIFNDTASFATQPAVRARDISPLYTPATESRREFSIDRILDEIRSGEDFSTISTPSSDAYRSLSSRSYLDSAGVSEAASEVSSVTSNGVNDNSNFKDSFLPSYSDVVSLPISSPLIPSVDHVLSDTTTSVHPLLAKPLKSYAVCNTENFKTTVKPRSYYHRKVAGRVPKYSDVDDLAELDAISDAYRAHVGLDSRNSTESSKYSARNYDSLSSYLSSDRPYPLENDYGITSRPSLSTGTSYRASSLLDYPSQSSSRYLRSSSLTRSVSRPTGGSAYGGSSYRPNYGPKAGYIKDLDADIEAFTGGSLGMMPSLGSGLGTVRTRVVPPTMSSYGYDDLSLYGW